MNHASWAHSQMAPPATLGPNVDLIDMSTPVNANAIGGPLSRHEFFCWAKNRLYRRTFGRL